MRYPCAWLSTLTPGHIQRAARRAKTCSRGKGPRRSGRRERESGAMPRGALRERWFIRARMRQTSCARSPGKARAALAKSRACVLSAPPLALGEGKRAEDGPTPAPEDEAWGQFRTSVGLFDK